MSMTMSEAREEEACERNCFEEKQECAGCGSIVDVLFDRRTDEPYREPEPCKDCGTNEWLDV